MTTEQFFEAIVKNLEAAMAKGAGQRLRPGVGRADMLAPDAEADQPRRDSPQHREALEQPQRQRHLGRAPPCAARAASDTRSCTAFCAAWMTRVGKHPPLLHLLSSGSTFSPRGERAGEDVRGRDRVLDGQVDADPADRRHGVRGVADREQAGPPPACQPVERHRQQFDLIPVLQRRRRRRRAPARRWATSSRNASIPLRLDLARPRPSGRHRRIANNRRGRSAPPACPRRMCRRSRSSASSPWAAGTRRRRWARRGPSAASRPCRAGPSCGHRRRSSAAPCTSSPSAEPNAGHPARPSKSRSTASASIRSVEGRIVPRFLGEEIEEFPLRHHAR